MKDIPRFIPLWLILLLTVSFVMCGCKTGGTRLSPNSAGNIIKPKSPEQINKEAKAKREEAKRLEQAKLQPTKPVKIEPVKSRPMVVPTPASAKTEVKPSDIKASNPKIEFKPTIIDSSSLKVETGTKSNVIPLPILPESKGKSVDGEIIIHKEASLKNETNWVQLFSFWMICFTGLLILWVLYDIIKDSLRMKKQGNPIKDHLENLKKPAKGTRAARKKSTKKKSK